MKGRSNRKQLIGQEVSAYTTTSFPRRREPSLSADRAAKISLPGISLLYPSYVPGSFHDVYKEPFRHARLPFLDSRLRGNDVVELNDAVELNDVVVLTGTAAETMLPQDTRCRRNDDVAPTTLLWVYSTFVRQLSGYALSVKNVSSRTDLRILHDSRPGLYDSAARIPPAAPGPPLPVDSHSAPSYRHLSTSPGMLPLVP